jgi:hypothetical protein
LLEDWLPCDGVKSGTVAEAELAGLGDWGEPAIGCGDEDSGTNESVNESAKPSKAEAAEKDELDGLRGGSEGGGPSEFCAEGGRKAL